MRVAGYIRVSTDEQVQEGHSLDAQRDRLINYCKSQEDWELVDIYPEEGRSAKDLNRPELQRLISDARDGKIDVVLVYRLDRLTRSVMDLYELLKTFEEYSVKFKSATEVYDTTTAMGKLFITIVAALAQWERENLSERVRFGMEQLVRDGNWHGGPVPFGFSWDGSTMSIIKEEAKILHELRRIYMEGEGFGGTAKRLNALGLTRRGNTWSAQSVWYTLDNPIYAGKIRYGEKKKNGKYASRKKEERVDVIWSDTNFPLIFTWEEYIEHTERMKRRQFYGASKKHEYWFTGVIRCARCGRTMIGRPYTNSLKNGQSQRYFYVCSYRSMGKGCHMPLLRQELAEKLILEYIENITINHEQLAAAKSELQNNKNDHTEEVERLNKELRSIADRRKKWQYMFAEDLISADDLRQRKREDDEREKAVMERLDVLRADDIGTSPTKMKALFDLNETWKTLDDTDRRAVMQTIFNSIVFECEVEKGVGRKGKTLPFFIKDVTFN